MPKKPEPRSHMHLGGRLESRPSERHLPQVLVYPKTMLDAQAFRSGVNSEMIRQTGGEDGR